MRKKEEDQEQNFCRCMQWDQSMLTFIEEWGVDESGADDTDLDVLVRHELHPHTFCQAPHSILGGSVDSMAIHEEERGERGERVGFFWEMLEEWENLPFWEGRVVSKNLLAIVHACVECLYFLFLVTVPTWSLLKIALIASSFFTTVMDIPSIH